MSLSRRFGARLIRLAGAPLARADVLAPADAIVILGAPVGRGGELAPVVRERVDAGVALWRRGLAPRICVSGGGPPGRAEADPMAERCRELGVPQAALRVERASRSTRDNAARVAELLAPEACRSVLIVSQPFHLRRAVACFRAVGLEARGWHIRDSVQYAQPRVAARWVAREYAAWVAEIAKRIAGR